MFAQADSLKLKTLSGALIWAVDRAETHRRIWIMDKRTIRIPKHRPHLPRPHPRPHPHPKRLNHPLVARVQP